MIRRFTFLFAALPAVLSAAELLSAVDEAFLRAQIRRIVDSAALGPGQLNARTPSPRPRSASSRATCSNKVTPTSW